MSCITRAEPYVIIDTSRALAKITNFRYFSSGFYQVAFSQCFSFRRGFQDRQILFVSVYSPFMSLM